MCDVIFCSVMTVTSYKVIWYDVSMYACLHVCWMMYARYAMYDIYRQICMHVCMNVCTNKSRQTHVVLLLACSNLM